MPFSTTTFGHAESNWAALVCFSITGFTASMPVTDLFWSRTKPRPPRLQAGRGVVSHLQQTLRKQPSRPLKSILNSHFCRKPERKMFPEVCMFSSQCYCSYLLNLFSFSRPVFSLRHLLCLLFHHVHFQLFHVSCLVTTGENTMLMRCCFILKAVKLLSNGMLLLWRNHSKWNVFVAELGKRLCYR